MHSLSVPSPRVMAATHTLHAVVTRRSHCVDANVQMFRRLAAGAQRAANKSWLGPSVLGGLYAAGAATGVAVYASEVATALACFR